MTVLTSRIAAALFLLIAVFQLALVLGAPWGAITQGGFVEGALPVMNRVIALLSMLLLVSFALIMLARAQFGPWKSWRRNRVAVLGWIVTAYAIFGVVANAASQSPLERWIWVPVGIVLSVCCLGTMLTTRRD